MRRCDVYDNLWRVFHVGLTLSLILTRLSSIFGVFRQGMEYGCLPFEFFRVLASLALGVFFSILMYRHKPNVLSVHKMIIGVVVLSAVEATSWLVAYSYMNKTGQTRGRFISLSSQPCCALTHVCPRFYLFFGGLMPCSSTRFSGQPIAWLLRNGPDFLKGSQCAGLGKRVVDDAMESA